MRIQAPINASCLLTLKMQLIHHWFTFDLNQRCVQNASYGWLQQQSLGGGLARFNSTVPSTECKISTGNVFRLLILFLGVVMPSQNSSLV